MASIYQKIGDTVAELIDKGAHQSIAKTTQFVAKKFGLSDRLIKYTHIEIRNRLSEPKFKRVPYDKRILFLPQCLRDSKKCPAKMNDEGWECAGCGRCQIYGLKKKAEELGYMKVIIAPGGSMVQKVVEKYKPEAVLGVGCFEEVNMGMDKTVRTNIPPQGIILLRDGCKDTAVNADEVVEKLEMADEKISNAR